MRLRDIVDDADRIATFIDGMGVDDFVADDRTIFAVEPLLQRLTEAAIQIDPDEAARIGSGLPIAQMRALGNRLRHEYRDGDLRYREERGPAGARGGRTDAGQLIARQ